MTDEVEQTGGSEEAPIVAVEEAAVKAAEVAKAADEAKAKEQAELALEKPEDKPKPEKDWRDKELAKKHAKIKESERREAELQQRIKDLEALAESRTAPVEGDPPVRREAPLAAPKVDNTEAVKAEAQKLYQQDKFNEACLAAEAKGKEVYKDEFEKAVSTIQTLGGFDPDTMVGILATDDPSKILYELGKNPDEYHRIMELDPKKRIVEMTKMAMSAAPKPKLSDAPAPVDPVGGRGGSNDDNELRDDLDDDEWNRRRDRQEKARWAAKNGRAA
jgi:hypothetical protein